MLYLNQNRWTAKMGPNTAKSNKTRKIISNRNWNFSFFDTNFYMIIEIIFSNRNIEPAHINLDINRLCKRTFAHLLANFSSSELLLGTWVSGWTDKIKRFSFCSQFFKISPEYIWFQGGKMILENLFFYWISHQPISIEYSPGRQDACFVCTKVTAFKPR